MMQPVMGAVIEEDSIDPNLVESYYHNHMTSQGSYLSQNSDEEEKFDGSVIDLLRDKLAA